MDKEIKVCTAWGAFFGSFERIFPNLYQLERPSQVENFDLVIFPGGEDISPRFYGTRNKYCGTLNDARDEFEKSVFNYAYNKTKVKMLGVCRGHQLINALLGGYIIQDIREEFGKGHSGWHSLDIQIESIFSKVFKNVNSLHHQGVIESGRGLTYTTKHTNLIESSENERIVSVQFHPEFMGDAQSREFFDLILEWVGSKSKKFTLKNNKKQKRETSKRKLDELSERAVREMEAFNARMEERRIENARVRREQTEQEPDARPFFSPEIATDTVTYTPDVPQDDEAPF